MSEIIKAVDLHVKSIFGKEIFKEYPYHNYEHTLRVVQSAKSLSEEAKLTDKEREILIIAAYFHDTGFAEGADNHEQYSVEIARKFLTKESYEKTNIEKVAKCILATKMDWIGDERLCTLIRDADLSGLAHANYHMIAEQLRKEKNKLSAGEIDEKSWLQENISFFNFHSYCSEEGKKLFQKGKSENLAKLVIKDYESKNKKIQKKKKKKGNKMLTIGSSKSAQTQLKTALRNHIDLSAIADNKANIMLSVNAIIITVALPMLVARFDTNPTLIIPTIILAIVSVISMIFATLSTRPIDMSGTTTMEMINNKKSNLFFFGNYYKMDFSSYEKGMQQVVADNEILDNSITRDLFFLGKSLGKKYVYLRWCYNFFMYGIVSTIIAFVIISFMS
jgi:hypothetical protein